jgi:glycosyltransferase involved in cell wall biosynthesis
VAAHPMNILTISPYYYPAQVYGGPVPAIRHLNQALSRSGHMVTTYTTDANGSEDLKMPLGLPVTVDDLPVTYFPRWWFGKSLKPSNLFFSPALGRQLKQLHWGDFDLILCHSTFSEPGRMAAKAAQKAGIPYLCYTHGCFDHWAWHHKHGKKRLYFTFVEKSILGWAAGIVVCNASEEQQLRHLGISTPIRRISWGAHLPDPENLPSKERLAELYPTLRDRSILLFLSRLHPKKGLDLLIPAFAALAQEFPDWLLVLAGPDEGGYQTKLSNMVERFGLAHRVVFTGMVTGEAKEALLANAELFVLPSYSEGFPVVVVEALGYGRPTVITTKCYVPEVAEKHAGLVVPPEQISLTEALREMLRDKNLRRLCGQNAKSLAREHFTWEAVSKQSEVFYQEVMRCHAIA